MLYKRFRIGKGVYQGYILSPCLLNLNAKYFVWNMGLDESQAGIKIVRSNSKNLRYADSTTLVAENRGTKELLDVGERGEWKSWLKIQHSVNEEHDIWFHHFMANRWGKSGNSDRFYFLGFQNHYGWCCSHEIKRLLLLGRKAMKT